MHETLTRLSSIAIRAKTPLGLAGIVMGVFYALVSQVLRLDIFENLGSAGTTQVINGLLDKLFYLAIASLVLAACAYCLGLYLRSHPPRRRSSLELITAGLDEKESEYTAAKNAAGRSVIRRRSRGA